jgi:hypothetical protein
MKILEQSQQFVVIFKIVFHSFCIQYLIGDHHWESSGSYRVETSGEDKKNINFED